MTFEPFTVETMKKLLPQLKVKEKYLEKRRDELTRKIKGIEDGTDEYEWLKLASAAVFPEIDTSRERVDGGSIDTDTLLHQLDQIHQLSIQQVEVYTEDLRAVSRELLKFSLIQSSALYLMEDSWYITDFFMAGLSYNEASAVFHISKSVFFKNANDVLKRFVDICNKRLEKYRD